MKPHFRFSLLAAALLAFAYPVSAAAGPSQGGQAKQAAATHVCPMHPDVRTAGGGACPICGMALVPIDPLAVRDYRLDVETTPHPPVVGRPFRLTLTVRDPDSRAIVRKFTEVHERQFHLFVLSMDLEHYDHVHPEQQQDGSWALDVTLPRPGFYKLYADFLPEGGTPQVIPRQLVTAGFAGDLASSSARLVPDRALRKTVGSMSVELGLPPGGLVAGRDEKLTYRLTDATTGAAVGDVEPYLGAWGHTLIMSEDTLHFVHAHPVELLPAGPARPSGGPVLTFKALLPKPGNYRVWTQIKRGGEVATAMFTIAVSSPTARR